MPPLATSVIEFGGAINCHALGLQKICSAQGLFLPSLTQWALVFSEKSSRYLCAFFPWGGGQSVQLRDTPKWKQNSFRQIEGNHLASLEAAKIFAQRIADAAHRAMLDTDLFRANRTSEAEKAKAKPTSAEAAADRSEDAPEKVKAVAKRLPRIHVPTLLAISMRAAELLIEASTLARDLAMEMLNSGEDPRPFMAQAPALFAQNIVEDLGIDLRKIIKTPPPKVAEAFELAQKWVDEARDHMKGRPQRPPPYQPDPPSPEPVEGPSADRETQPAAGAKPLEPTGSSHTPPPEPTATSDLEWPKDRPRPTLDETLRLMQHFTKRKIT